MSKIQIQDKVKFGIFCINNNELLNIEIISTFCKNKKFWENITINIE